MDFKKAAYQKITGRRNSLDTLFGYYEGNQPIRYSTQRLQEIFEDDMTFFAQNWCSIVVDTTAERVQLASLDHKSGKGREAAWLDECWSSTGLEQEAQDSHEDALITGMSYLIVWKNKDGVQCYHNDPRLCDIVRDEGNPNKILAAAKLWKGEDEVNRLNLYYPDKIEKYKARRKDPGGVDDYAPDKTERNPFGVVPVFCLQARRGRTVGELSRSILVLQDAVNKELCDLMVASEFDAFTQRAFFTNADLSKLKNRPGVVWEIPIEEGTNPKAEEFGGKSLGNFLEVMGDLSNSIAIISRTPKFYFFGEGGNVSGDALIAMEAPLIKKAKVYQGRFSRTWQEVGLFLLALNGMKAKRTDIVPRWQDAETVQPGARAQGVLDYTNAGMPLLAACRLMKLTEKEIEDVQKELDAEKKSSTGTAEAELAKIRAEETARQAGEEEVTAEDRSVTAIGGGVDLNKLNPKT